VVQDPRTGGWWLSEQAYIAHRDQQPKKAVRMLLVLVTIALVIVAIGMIALVKTTP
jgi:accessory gene regulator protein AgrB